jgi:hypothetical protein
LFVESIIEKREEHLLEKTGEPASPWVKYCRSARSDAEYSACQQSIERKAACFIANSVIIALGRRTWENERLARKFEKTGNCYRNAVVRQLSFDSTSESLWSHAGAVYDYIDTSDLIASQDEVDGCH